jgi:hypothetical protein
MRGGRLLAENSPKALLEEYNTDLLQDIVLKLCRKDKIGNQQGDMVGIIKENERDEENAPPEVAVVESSQKSSNRKRMISYTMDSVEDPNGLANTFNRIRALTLKNILVMMRNIV